MTMLKKRIALLLAIAATAMLLVSCDAVGRAASDAGKVTSEALSKADDAVSKAVSKLESDVDNAKSELTEDESSFRGEYSEPASDGKATTSLTE